MALERLQKILARAGVGSRRACEELVAEGRVTVDGETVAELGAKADPETQDVRLDGRRLRMEPHEYWLLNKPKGVVCTNRDPAGRRRAVDLVPGTKARLFPVGRLDADSKGLVLLTNDGELANRLAHPRYEVPKTYLATVSGKVTPEDVQALRRGVYLAEGKARAARIRLLKKGHNRSRLEITLREGRNRQIRRMLARLGHPVRDLVRTRVGRLSLRGLGSGRSRPLTPKEVKYLTALAEGREDEGAEARPRRGRRSGKGGQGGDPRGKGRKKRGPSMRGGPDRGRRSSSNGAKRPPRKKKTGPADAGRRRQKRGKS